MRFFPITSVGILLLTVALWSCENCGPSAEPLLNLSLQSTSAFKIDTIYSPDARQPLPAQPYSVTSPTTSRQVVLPINLNTDSTRYVFQLSGRQDTITVFYKRDFSYKDRKCGYVVNLIEPTGKQARTTRGTLRYASYFDNRDGSFLRGKQDTGIYMTIQL